MDIESAPLDALDADLLTPTVSPGSRLHGVEIFELRLAKPSIATLIIRDGDPIVPEPDTQLREGDDVLIVTTPATRERVERRLRAVGRRGRLAHWYGEHGDPDPHPSHTTAKGDTKPWTSRTPPSPAPAPSTTATPGKETTSASSSPTQDGGSSWSTTEPTPTLRRTR
ncbi:TrkA C-terminal domain-containing protein [Nonomuraea guangzhouensis]|uniref:TrkA C-terminal domain-containing protein n=1 Tax=Nonomuraea guangzhouensis TaxID=1291555 RepID=A0ABW4GT61_9ACTN|nr:TrkA C-terminal domain-containing protein [Nonomuraea guangzhouensis]